jgi:hypothetical protein
LITIFEKEEEELEKRKRIRALSTAKATKRTDFRDVRQGQDHAIKHRGADKNCGWRHS